ncbi:carboxypeptidase B-like [Choristoneura fumiferana]|uniref:carboxypeptidase B-like n=1 Tax=Choristoneura fumiferana TaxID=7141 RepID=UPI003D159CAE
MYIKILLVTFIYHTSCDAKTYENYTLFRGIPTNEKEIAFFSNLSKLYEVVYWRRTVVPNKPVDFTISPTDLPRFLDSALDSGIPLTTLIEDVQSAFNKQTIKTYIRRKLRSFDWNSFYRLDDIYNWLDDLVKSYPKDLQLINIGKSLENRDIFAVRLKLQGSMARSKVIVEGGIHAREWVGPAFVTYMLNEMVHSPFSNNKELYNVAMGFEWYFVPVINPDGYEYTHTHDRLWRKNRRGRYGIDLNRNFGIAFGTVGVSKSDKYDETYCGPSAFSEPETRVMAEFTRENSKNLMYYIAFHAYGQFFIIPYSFTPKQFDNYNDMVKLGYHVAAKIHKEYKTEYTVGNAYSCVGYLASGSSTDWVKKAFKTKYVVTMELRDTGTYAFALPPELILPTCRETMDGMIGMFSPTEPLSEFRPTSSCQQCQPSFMVKRFAVVFLCVSFI